jgi:hypothetical protein
MAERSKQPTGGEAAVPRTVNVRRYVTPLREGGSLPAIVEGDDEGLYVLKFRGSGQGPKTLVAELLCGEIARAAGLRIPEIVFMELDPDLARTEPDSEIQALIRASAGLNIGLDYLPGAVTFDPIAWRPDARLASCIVWFDAFVTNVDRTAKNVNLLVWHRELYLIDHGATLVFQHDWAGAGPARAAEPFMRIRDHVLLPWASELDAADAEMKARLTPALLRAIVATVPDAWLIEGGGQRDRDVYLEHLLQRLAATRNFVEEAQRARALLV